ncbi:AI-2E family transporter [Desulfobacca acetoxidans]
MPMDNTSQPKKEEAVIPTVSPQQPSPSPAMGDNFPSQFAKTFFGVLTVVILYFSYLIVKPYLVEIFLALVLFFISKPLYQAILGFCRGWRGISSALTCLLLALFIILPILMLAGIIASQALDLYNLISAGLHSGTLWQVLTKKLAFLEDYAKHLNLPVNLENLKIEEVIRTALISASQFIYNNSIGLVKGFTTFLFSLLLILFITFFCFLEGDDFIDEIKRLSPLDQAHNDEILGDVENTIRATIRGTVIVAIIQGILGGLGFFCFGVPRAAFWGTVMVPASVIPVIGAAIIWLPAALFLFFQGHIWQSLGMVLWGGVFIGSIDNLVKPYLMKGARQTPTIFTLFAIMGGITYFGMIGFILGPLILSFLLSVLEIYRKTILIRSQTPPSNAALPIAESSAATPGNNDTI